MFTGGTNANIVNKMQRHTNTGWSSSLVVWRGGIKISHRKILACYEVLQRVFELAGCFEHGSGPFGSVKGGEFLDQLSEYWMIKKDSAPQTQALFVQLDCKKKNMNTLLIWLTSARTANVIISLRKQKYFTDIHYEYVAIQISTNSNYLHVRPSICDVFVV